MTRNELEQRVDQVNQELSDNVQPASNTVASGTNTQSVSDSNAQEMDRMLANIFKRGGY